MMIIDCGQNCPQQSWRLPRTFVVCTILLVLDGTLAARPEFEGWSSLNHDHQRHQHKSRLSELRDNHQAGPDDIDVRPNNGKDPDKIKVKMTLKRFYYLNMIESVFMADVVFQFRWKDERVKSVIPSGLESLTLSQEHAQTKLWMPEVAVTNRDIGGVEVLSTSVTIKSDGDVTKIQRVLGRLKNKFTSTEYPFDTQTLEVICASSRYMANEVLLEADDKASEVEEDAFEGRGFSVDSHKVEAYVEKTGPLEKSRGKMVLNVRRGRRTWYSSIMPSTIAILIVSYLVFWLPFQPPFAMPRMALSTISFLAMSGTANAYLAGVRGVPGLSWGEVIFQNWYYLNFGTVCLNIMLEYICHVVKLPELGTAIQSEMKVIFPVVCIISHSVSIVYSTRFLAPVLSNLALMIVIVKSYKRCQKALAESGQPELEPVSHAVSFLAASSSANQPESSASADADLKDDQSKPSTTNDTQAQTPIAAGKAPESDLK
mmetsp:Transcript_99536/g.177220  ORF Transcript_99536/g.177220 Transcript_99536/m.177220 type:complete len:486 (-) Transcript_99536:128-1585(-)